TMPVGNAGEEHINTVTAKAMDPSHNVATASATATVNYLDVAPTITVTKTANVSSVSEGGAGNQSVIYAYTVTNTSPASTDPVTISSVNDSVLGELLTAPITLAPGASITLYKPFTMPVQNAGTSHTNVVTVKGTDDESDVATASDSYTINYTNVAPSIKVDKTGPASINEGGASATYTFTITNTSVSTDPVTVLSINDNKFGNLLGAAEAANG